MQSGCLLKRLLPAFRKRLHENRGKRFIKLLLGVARRFFVLDLRGVFELRWFSVGSFAGDNYSLKCEREE